MVKSMLNKLLTVLFVTFYFAPTWGFINAKNSKLSGSMTMGGISADSQQLKSRIAGLDLHWDLLHTLHPTFNLHVNGGVTLESGSNDSQHTEEFKAESHLDLTEAAARWSPFSFIRFEAGAINQKAVDNILLLSSIPFPAAKEVLSIGNQYAELSLFAEQAIPNNYILSQRLGSVQEGTPRFYIETAELTLKPHPSLSLGGTFSHFAYDNLSRGVAHESRFLGNSVSGVSQENAFFLYDYIGWAGGFHLAWDIHSTFKTLIKGRYLLNDEAPTGQDRGQIYTWENHIKISSNNTLKLRGQTFRNEADSSPAFYNSKFLGHNNREGYEVGGGMSFSDLALDIELGWIKSDVYDPSLPQAIYQSDLQIFFLYLNKSYDIF